MILNKQSLLLGVALLELALAAPGQPLSTWTTPAGVHDYSTAANIYATNFVNPSGATFDFEGPDGYKTTDTLNYTNRGIINVDPGFDFATYPATAGQEAMASNWVNEASGDNGVINVTSGFFATTVTTVLGALYSFATLSGSSECVVSAANILNSGTVNMDASSLMKFDGYNVNMSYGTLSMANANSTNLDFFLSGSFISELGSGVGYLDGYWGVGDAGTMLPPAMATLLSGFDVEANISDLYQVTERNQEEGYLEMYLPKAVTYVQDSGVVGSNRWVQAVFLQNTNTAFVNTVYFPGAQTGFSPADELVVQWQWLATNLITKVVTTNYIVLDDNFGEVTNIGLVLDGDVNSQALFPEPTYRPENYNIFEGLPASAFIGPTPAASSSSIIPGQLGAGLGPYTNQYAAYEAYFTPSTALPTDVAGGNVTNLPGRIEITARNVLSLTNTTITALNYLLLKATNHFAGAPLAQISSPNNDFYLRTTNGVLLFTNLVLPYLNVPSGPCELWSARYTNVDAFGITNSYHVLFVNSEFSPITTPLVQTLNLAVTNFIGASNELYLSDVLDVTSNLLVECQALTLTTNGTEAITPAGQLNLFNPNTLWPASFPVLQYLTNWGQISNGNSIYFSDTVNLSPYSLASTNAPYQAFVNHGNLLDSGTEISSLYFENEGVVNAGAGSITIENAYNAVMSNGIFYAAGDVTIGAASLLVSNHAIICGGALTLSNSYYLDDGSYATASALTVSNRNSWSVENGINLPVLPLYSSLLGTTVTNISLNGGPVVSVWAGADRGPSVSGFANNAALGHLILDGQNTNSLFVFSPPGAGSAALYVDELDLTNSATLMDDGDLVNVYISPGMTIYYGRARLNGTEASVLLSGQHGTGHPAAASSGTLVWVTNYYCGAFSSTNLLYPNGTSNFVNEGVYFNCAGLGGGDALPSSYCSDGYPVLSAGACPESPGTPAPAATPMAPSISLSADALQYTAPATVSLRAAVAANGHAIQQVLFYDGSQYGADLLASNSIEPFSCVWSNLSEGSYSPTAVLLYDEGSVMVSSPLTVNVETAPLTNSANTTLELTPPFSDTNVAPIAHITPAAYHGLFYDTNNGVSTASSGYFTANTTAHRAISGKIYLPGKTYSFSSHVATNGLILATNGAITLQLQLTSDLQQISGTISSGAWSASIEALAQTPHGDNPYAGKYTMLLPSATNVSAGYGVGTVTVDESGNVQWTGNLPDGTKLTPRNTAVSSNGFSPLFASLYGGNGEFISWVQFASNGLTSDDAIWIKPSEAATKALAGPFTNQMTISGGVLADKLPEFGYILFSGAGLSLSNYFEIKNNHATMSSGSDDKLTLSFTPSKGLFSGSFKDSGGSKVSFSGAFWSTNNAAGYYLNNGESGSVLLGPPLP